MERVLPDSWAEKARFALAEQAKDVLDIIDGQYRGGLIGAAERDQKLVAAAHELVAAKVSRLNQPASGLAVS